MSLNPRLSQVAPFNKPYAQTININDNDKLPELTGKLQAIFKISTQKKESA